jgi:hypothetical protein
VLFLDHFWIKIVRDWSFFDSIDRQCSDIDNHNWRIAMLRKSIALPMGITAAIMAAHPAIAGTATKPMRADCLWIEHGKTSITQACTVTGNAVRGGSSFYIDWADGMKTHVSCSTAEDGCFSEGTRRAHLHSRVELGRMYFPQAIVLENLGVIVLEYQSGQD